LPTLQVIPNDRESLGSVYQESVKAEGSATGATPKATDKIANPIKMIEAHTPKAMSAEAGRSRVATGGYKTVGENKVMLRLQIECLNLTWWLDRALWFESIDACANAVNASRAPMSAEARPAHGEPPEGFLWIIGY